MPDTSSLINPHDVAWPPFGLAPANNPVASSTLALTWSQHQLHQETNSLQLYLIPQSIDKTYAIASFAKLGSRGKSLRPSPIKRSRSTTIFIAGTAENYYSINKVVHSVPRGKKASALSVKHVHANAEVDWLTGQPRLRLEGYLRDPAMPQLTILPVVPDLLANANLEALAKLRDLARAMKKQLVIATHAESVEDFGASSAMADDTVLSDPCIPDPHYTAAWTIESSSGKHFHPDGFAKLMIQITVENGRVDFKCSRFVAAEPYDRVLWYLAAEGHERAEIANVLKTSIDVIDQRLAMMRPLQSAHVPTAWRDAFAGIFDFSALAS